MSWQMYASAGVGAAVAAFAWSASGFSAMERRVLAQRLGCTARKAWRAVSRVVIEPVERAFAQLASGGADEHATLAEVSEMIDIVRLGLSAGLSFDAAVEIYCASRSTELSRRLKQALVSWRAGVSSREEELMAVAGDIGVRALESFAIAAGEALALGAPLAETLQGQSTEIRAAHRASVERAIERAPVKLLIPTGTLILPALLLSILGPLLAAGKML